MLGFAIQRRLEQGTTDEEVDALVERFRSDAGLLFTVDTFEYLARGGRIGRARAWAGELFHIKPILTIEEGEVVPLKRVRGNKKAFLRVHVGVRGGHAATRRRSASGSPTPRRPSEAEALAEMVRQTRPAADLELVTTLGPVVGAHAGPGTIGFFWFDDG